MLKIVTHYSLIVDCSSQVKDLGVIFDRVLSLRQHVSYTSKTCRFHLRNISRIRKYIPRDTSVVLVKSLVMSRLDYSNGLFYGLPKCTVSGLQAVQNSAARIVTQERLQDHDSMSWALIGLHWLPVDKRIKYKLSISCCRFQRLPPARGGTAQKKIIHLANWSQLIHPGPASCLTNFFCVE